MIKNADDHHSMMISFDDDIFINWIFSFDITVIIFFFFGIDDVMLCDSVNTHKHTHTQSSKKSYSQMTFDILFFF